LAWLRSQDFAAGAFQHVAETNPGLKRETWATRLGYGC
jgi:hypothetical protein